MSKGDLGQGDTRMGMLRGKGEEKKLVPVWSEMQDKYVWAEPVYDGEEQTMTHGQAERIIELLEQLVTNFGGQNAKG